MLIHNNFKLLLIRASKKITAANGNVIARSCGKSSDDGKLGEDEVITNKKSETEKPFKSVQEGEESAANKLNRLLASMQTDNQWLQTQSSTALRPGEAHRAKKLEHKTIDKPTTNILEAAKKVASYLDTENKHRIESELLTKLLASTHSRQQDDNGESAETADEPNTKLSDLFVGIKVDRRKPVKQTSRSDYINSPAFKTKWEKNNMFGQQRSNNRKGSSEIYPSGEDLYYGDKRLDIFNNLDQLKDSPDMLNTWSQLEQHSLKLQVAHAPDNYFEKLILWTEQGKLWRFPIDNEQDWADEHNVDFSEHVFLEQHLESWCPSHGPLRHFMELVCIGLSKNHSITAKEKKEHILWYRDYFESKKAILRDLLIKDNSLPTNLSHSN